VSTTPCQFSMEWTGQEGLHTGRRRYAVKCLTCNEVLHEGTTGPADRINQHLRDVAKLQEVSG
jgi:hypothetical protein